MIDRDPVCPHCDVSWSYGPRVQEDGAKEIRIVSCPTCAKVVAILPTVIYTAET